MVFREVLASSVPWTALLCRYFPLRGLWSNFSHPLLPHPSSCGGYFHPHDAGLPFRSLPPFLILFSSKGLARTRLQREKKTNNQPPASCQLCLWPIALVSCLTLIPQFIQLRAPGQTERLRNLPETSAFPKPHKQFPASIPAPAARLGMPVHLGEWGGTGCHRGAPHHLIIFPLVGTAANTPLASQPAAPPRRWGMS